MRQNIVVAMLKCSYWRKKKPSHGSVSNALQEFEAFLRPSARHVIEVKQRDSKQRDSHSDDANSGTFESKKCR